MPYTKLLLPRVPCEQTETQTSFLSCKCSVSPKTQYIHSQAPNTKPMLTLLIPGKFDSLAPANQIFSIFLFLVLSPIKLSLFLPYFTVLKRGLSTS